MTNPPVPVSLRLDGVSNAVTNRGAISAWPRDGGDDPRARAIAQARRLMENDRAASTRDKYARMWALFVQFVAEHEPDADVLPVHPALVGLFVGALRDRRQTKATLLVHIAAIKYAHELIGAPAPWLQSVDLQRQIKGLRRAKDPDRQSREAIERSEATALLATLGEPKTRRDTRDQAVFALGWLSALRRSNIAALRVKDVRIKRDVEGRRYLDVYVRESKTDQEALGRNLVVSELPGANPLCAVRALERWFAVEGVGGDPDGPLFPSFTLSRNEEKRLITDRAISGEDVRRIVKRLYAKAGLDATRYAAHSLRRGFATSMDEGGVPRAMIREHGGWKTDTMLDRYSRAPKARANPVRDLFG